MQLKEGFILKKIVDDYIVVPTGNNLVDFGVVVSLNETGAYLWEQLYTEKTKEELVKSLALEYEITEADVEADVEEFIELLKTHNFLVD